MKILFITWQFPPYTTGGVGTACYGMVRSLLEKGGTEVALLLPWPSPLFFHLTRKEDLDRVPSEIAQRGKLPGAGLLHGYLDTRSLNNLYSILEEGIEESIRLLSGLTFDLIHCHDWITFPAAYKIKQIFPLPLFVHFHSLEKDRNPDIEDPRVKGIEVIAAKKADRIITVSRSTASAIETLYGITRGKIRILYNGYSFTDSPFPAGQKEKKKGMGTNILFLGRMTAQKGPELLLEAAGKICLSFPETVFVFAGTGDLAGTLRIKANEKIPAGRIRFTGFVPHQTAETLLEEADILVIPSITEPFGIVCVEAMAKGTAVILGQNAGAAELVKNVVTIDPVNPNNIKGAISYLLNNKDVLNTLKSEARKEAQNLDWRNRIPDLLALYSEPD